MKIIWPIKLSFLMMFLIFVLLKLPNNVFAGPWQGVDANVYSNDGTNWNIDYSNDESVFGKDTTIDVKLVVYACRGKNDTSCDGGSSDYIPGSRKDFDFQITLGGSGDPDISIVKDAPMGIDCGRLQGDLVPKDESGNIGGGVYSAFPNNCPEPTLQPTNTPTPTPTPTGKLPTATPTTAPTDTPTGEPTATPTTAPTDTPPMGTPAQPTSITTRGLSPGRTATGQSGTILALRWICLDMKPCSTLDGQKQSYCTNRGDYKEKVILQTKVDAGGNVIGVLPNSKTWVFECVEKDGKRICTNGIDSATDNLYVGQVFGGVNNLDYLRSNEGYRHAVSDFYYPTADLVVPNPFNPATGKIVPGSNPQRMYYFNLNGRLGPFEWESHTNSDLKKLFLAMNIVNSTANDARNTTQLNSTFSSENPDKSCVMISWDPYGIIFDSKTLAPIKGAEVTLLKKDNEGKFVKIGDRDVLIGIQNPITTLEDGYYNFRVDDGIYKLEVKAPGYEFAGTKDVNPDAQSAFKSIYDGGEIVIKDGQQQEFNIAMKNLKENVNPIEAMTSWFLTILNNLTK